MPEFRNVHYEADVDYMVRIARTLLIPIGVWPLYRGDTILDNIKLFIHTGLIFCAMCFLMIPHIIYTFFDCTQLTRYMKVIATQIFSLLGIIKFLMMIIKKKQVADCLRLIKIHYKNVECEEDRSLMIKAAKIGRSLTTLYLSIAYGGALPYHIILPLMEDRIVKEDNTTQIPLPYLSDYVFFEVDASPYYEMLFVIQIIISTIILSANFGIYSLIATCVMHACCMFEVVSRQMETIFEYSVDEIQGRLKSIIKQHVVAIRMDYRYSEAIEQALNIVFLSEIIGCTLNICFLEYGVLVEWEDNKKLSAMTYIVLMTSTFVNVFIISFIGERVKEQSNRVGKVTYSIKWYNVPQSIIKDLSMIILRTSRPSCLTAGKIFDLSLQGFCDVCKTSAAYLNFIRTMTA